MVHALTPSLGEAEAEELPESKVGRGCIVSRAGEEICCAPPKVKWLGRLRHLLHKLDMSLMPRIHIKVEENLISHT